MQVHSKKRRVIRTTSLPAQPFSTRSIARISACSVVLCGLFFASVEGGEYPDDDRSKQILKPGSDQVRLSAEGDGKQLYRQNHDSQDLFTDGSYLWGVSAVIGDSATAKRQGVDGFGLLAKDGASQRDSAIYEADFTGVFPSLARRQDAGQIGIRNNSPLLINIVPGSTEQVVFTNETLWGLQGNTEGSRAQRPESLRTQKSTQPESGEVDDEQNSNLVKRQNDDRKSTRTVHISVNTCLQPAANDSASDPPPQLTLYISQSAENSEPGPSNTDLPQKVVKLEEGYALVTLEAGSDIFIGVHGPLLPESFSNPWNCEIAVSTDAPFHTYNDGKSIDGSNIDENDLHSLLYFVDGDARSALLVTDNLTEADAGTEEFQQWADIDPPPYVVFVHNRNDTAIRGLQRSFCGLRNRAQISVDRNGNAANVERSMTLRGLGNKPKQQFLIEGLNASSDYVAYLATMGDSKDSGVGVIGGGGQLWPATSFFTKADSNCQVIFDLSFCSDVAYAVPSNPRTFPNMPELARLYDDAAAAIYQNFTYSLQQIACNTTSTAQYSLVRNCDDCARDYKNWLCAVTIPRCADFSSQDPFLQPRNLGQPSLDNTDSSNTGDDFSAKPESDNDTDEDENKEIKGYEDTRPPSRRLYANSSRNPLIDELIQPGPYKEVLPCDDLCYSIVQSCPAALGFKCPLPGRGLERSYGKRSRSGSITCSYLGAAYYLNEGSSLTKSLIPLMVSVLAMVLMAVMLNL